MRYVKLAIFFILLMSLMAFDLNNVLACRCAQPESLKTYYDRATAVFVGEVVEIGDVLPPSGDLFQFFEVKFKVEKWWKGGDTKEVIILDTQSTCSPNFEKGKKWLVYATGERLKTNVCDGTVNLKIAKEHLKSLGVGKVPSSKP
jgi:hypothetical protein